MIERVIVSRHAATIDWLRGLAGDVPVLAAATADDVRGKVVYGNLPLHLAAEANVVFAVSFEQSLPRGEDVADIAAYGPRVEPFFVQRRNHGPTGLWDELTGTAPVVGATAPIRPIVPDIEDDGAEGQLLGAIGSDGVYRTHDQWRTLGRNVLQAQLAAERAEEAGR